MSETWHTPPETGLSHQDPNPTEPSSYRPLPSMPSSKPKIVGLFGLPGAGTEILLEQLKKEMCEEELAFYDGSMALAVLCPGGLMAYNELDFAGRRRYREMTIGAFEKECMRKDIMGVVIRHLYLWNEYNDCFSSMPIVEIKAHTHILYLELPFTSYLQNRKNIFPHGQAEEESSQQWRAWQESEISYLRRFCQKKEITFTIVTPHLSEVPKLSSLLQSFHVLTEEQNRAMAKEQLLEIMSTFVTESVETVLLFDADGTLTPQDSEAMLWDHIPGHLLPPGVDFPPSKEAYCEFRSNYHDYLQAAFLHEEVFDDSSYDAVCRKVADSIKLYPDMWSLLHRTTQARHVFPIILTGGPRQVWTQVMEILGLTQCVGVIGGGRHTDRALMTPDVKGWLVSVLQDQCHTDVWAFGSGLVDLIMLMKADHPVIITEQEAWLSEDGLPDWKEALLQMCPELHEVNLTLGSRIYLHSGPYGIHLFGRALTEKIFARRLQISYLATDHPSEILTSFVSEGSPSYRLWTSVQYQVGSLLATRLLREIFREKDTILGPDPPFPANVTVLATTPGSMPMACGIHSEFAGTSAQLLSPNALAAYDHPTNRILTATRVLVLVKSVIITEDFLLKLLHRHGPWMETLQQIIVISGVISAPVLERSLLARIVGRMPHARFATMHLAEMMNCDVDACPEAEYV